MTEILPASHAEVSRRTLLKGAAWSAPAIVVAAAVPAAAASDPPVDPALITLNLYWTVLGLNHGFTIGNTSTQLVSALVAFTGSASPTPFDDPESSAIANLVAATDAPGSFSESATGGATAGTMPDTYQALWADDIAYAASRATRSGQMTFSLPPGSSFSFWQTRFLPLTLRTITATVTSLAAGGGPLTPISGGAVASFTI